MTRFLTHVLLERPAALSVRGLMAGMRRFVAPGSFESLAPLDPPPSGKPDGMILLSAEGVGVVVMFREGPAPTELRNMARLGPTRPGEAARPTGAHVVIGLVEAPTGPAAALRGARTVSLTAGVLADLFRAPAVIFAEGRTFTPGPEFVAAAREIREGVAPARIWVGCDLREGPEGCGAVTRGLTPFVGRELQIHPCALEASALRRRLTDMALPLIHSGLGFQDGATIALSSGDRFQARHLVASPLTGEPVVGLTLEEALAEPARRSA
ncbi:hypothetical protein [Neomegalonema sp.]|uniref:hypothetical protein n=1 Tax=Neomegalonema sp. TaxID=2039713 RepID=UPI00260821DB|nr:hypothetical protein [Neomegalonema sp.]MDD2869477.1 hypothetical protein [Neomegalonema sp.]